ncbi:hypothetical protein [Streptomyces sp. ME19-01-6]|uniref:hypothetical protein n=1 Tax=Streptomyces sp. ME19-01-6 TaxID=3028686 RepID=UPI0029B4FF43|nr:hypothetical protein [Streptomyces sp. ME19-01-6]MDX3233451.1 hypothetical protein [Streptomyces sp. ME19-01-6]
MLPVGCIAVLNAVSGECERASLKVSEADLPGTYRGPDGMRITLEPLARGGRLQVQNWPKDPFLDDGRRFRGRGSWSYQVVEATNGERIPHVELGFEGVSFDDIPVEDQYLLVGGTPEKPVLLEQDDPDNCPDAEFRQ